MTTYTNAPASRSALFDNAPTTDGNRDPLFRHGPGAAFCAVEARDYVDGVTAIWANGRTQRGRCRADKVLTAADAREALAHGALQVFVMAGDVEAVRSGAQGND